MVKKYIYIQVGDSEVFFNSLGTQPEANFQPVES